MKEVRHPFTTLCWACKRSTNTELPDKRTCSWAAELIPVEGWKANTARDGAVTVLECPLFLPEEQLCESCFRKTYRGPGKTGPCKTVPVRAGNTNYIGYCSKYVRLSKDAANDGAVIDLWSTAARKVKQFTKEHKLISTWPSLTAAANAVGVNVSSIIRCCRGSRKSSGGFIWEYEEGAVKHAKSRKPQV